ncbi:MAG: sulfite oxidase heme-binding subunit YedZ [Gammaproteobacteria bacterium]
MAHRSEHAKTTFELMSWAAGQRARAGRLLKPLVFVLACVPAALLIAGLFTGGLGVNPVETITHRTGETALQLLLLTLAVTPLRRLSGWQVIARLRRMLGLFAFFYVTLHFTIYAVLDASLDPAYVLDDIVKRPYITIGFLAACTLVPLAATSTNAMVKRLGGAAWRRLHKLVYVAAAVAVTHYLWLVKADVVEPAIYAAMFIALMTLRLPALANSLPRWRRLASVRRDNLRRRGSGGAGFHRLDGGVSPPAC